MFKKQKLNAMAKFFFGISLLALFLVFGKAQAEGNAALYFSEASETHKVGQSFVLDVNVNPYGNAIDTIRVNLHFDPAYLEIKSVSRNAAYSYSAGGNVLDNNHGYFSYGSGMPNGSNQINKFLSLTFVVKKTGTTQVSIDPDSLLLSDGVNEFNGQGSSAALKFIPADPVKTDPQKKPLPTETNAASASIGENAVKEAKASNEAVSGNNLSQSSSDRPDITDFYTSSSSVKSATASTNTDDTATTASSTAYGLSFSKLFWIIAIIIIIIIIGIILIGSAA